MSLENIKELVLSKINIEDFYRQHVKITNLAGGSEEMVGHCPFHDDKKTSISINIKSGLWNCFTCQVGGTIFDFYMKSQNCDFSDALKFFSEKAGISLKDTGFHPKEINIIDKKIANDYHSYLLNSEIILKKFIDKRGLSLETIKMFNLGYDSASSRYTIPIYDKYNNLVNIRKYDMDAKDKGYKMVNYTVPVLDGNSEQKKDKIGKKIFERLWGAIRIFNIKLLLDKSVKQIVLCEGETDCMIAVQNKIPAITVTGGAGSFKSEWSKYFKGKIVYIIYDLDEAGKKGAKRIAEFIKNDAEKVYIVTLPEDLGKGGDITDFFVNKKYGIDKLKECMEASIKESIQEEKIYDVKLSETIHAKYRGKRIRTQILVTGKNDTAYIVPSRATYICQNGGMKKNCINCQLSNSPGGEYEYIVDPSKPEILDFINVSKDQQKLAMKKILGITCPFFEVSHPEGDNINVEEIRAIPKMTSLHDTSDNEYSERTLYYIGSGIKTNQTYTIEGYVFPEPKKQLGTVIIEKAEMSNDNIESFELTDEIKEQLKIFQVAEGQKISEKINDIYADLERNVTHIWGRRDMMLAFDWMMHSPLWIPADGTLVKGWVVGFVLGDTATGKTELIKNMLEHYQLGERLGGQSITMPGLLGAVTQQNSGSWMVHWGRLPLNDKRAIIIEEITDMQPEVMERLTDILSSGKVQIVKANGYECTNARTRMFFVSNPKYGANLEAYSNGPDAIREIIKKNEDIRRMDFILTVSKRDVTMEVINRPFSEIPEIPHKYTKEACHNLGLWCWSRKPNQIKFTPEAAKTVLDKSKYLIKKYHSSFPIVEEGDTKNKIRRLSASTAGRLYSTDETGENLIIEEKHVLFVVWNIEQFFCKESMSFDMYSNELNRKFTLTDAKKEKYIKGFKMLPGWKNLVRILWSTKTFKKSDIGDRLGLTANSEELKKLFHWLSEYNLIKGIGSYGYKAEGNLLTILRELQKDVTVIAEDEISMPDFPDNEIHEIQVDKDVPEKEPSPIEETDLF